MSVVPIKKLRIHNIENRTNGENNLKGKNHRSRARNEEVEMEVVEEKENDVGKVDNRS